MLRSSMDIDFGVARRPSWSVTRRGESGPFSFVESQLTPLGSDLYRLAEILRFLAAIDALDCALLDRKLSVVPLLVIVVRGEIEAGRIDGLRIGVKEDANCFCPDSGAEGAPLSGAQKASAEASDPWAGKNLGGSARSVEAEIVSQPARRGVSGEDAREASQRQTGATFPVRGGSIICHWTPKRRRENGSRADARCRCGVRVSPRALGLLVGPSR